MNIIIRKTSQKAPPDPKYQAFKIMLSIFAILLCIIASLIAFYAITIKKAMTSVDREEKMLPDENISRLENDQHDKSIDFLILGSDSRSASDPGRSDVIILAHIPADRSAVYLISYPRDMWVEIPNYGQAKINEAYAQGGPALTVQTIENLNGIRIDHVAETSFQGFIDAIDAIGGVTLYNEIESSTGRYYFPQGTISLNGDSALAYTQQRKELPNGDLDRAKRQRNVVTAVINKMLTMEVLSNPLAFNNVLSSIASSVRVDSELTNADITDLVFSLLNRGPEIRHLQVPISGVGVSNSGQSIVLSHQENMSALSEALANDNLEEYWHAHKDDPPISD